MRKDARDRLILDHVKYVTIMARYRAAGAPSVDAEEMIGEALLELVETVRHYDPKKGDFKSYLNRRVHGAISDRLRRDDVASRDQRLRQKQGRSRSVIRQQTYGDAADLALILPGFPVTAPMQEVLVDLSMARERARRAYAALPMPYRHVAEQYGGGRTLIDIARDFGVTESRVCQILKEARRRLAA